ncbi:MAG: DUF3667 domain-containing protein [Pedobacter sp.]|nr:DUF3667 domain-containing protein [Pedobacter sp.]MDQ8054069.1 DUF3667 domain-containing protein [Pedobacter sp.]
MQQPSITCKNCNYHFNGKFCNNCGQNAHVGPISFKEIVHEIWHNLTHTDKGYLQLFWYLLIKPGQTIRNYLNGRRKSYFSPLTFYLVTTSLLIVCTNPVFEKEDEIYHLNNEFAYYIGKSLNFILFFSIPIISILLYLFFRKQFRNLAEAVVTSIFAFGGLNFFLLLGCGFFYIFIGLHNEYKGIWTLLGYAFMFYILFDFLRPRRFLEIIKIGLLSIFFYFFVEMFAKGLFLMWYGVPFSKLDFF